MTPETLKSTCIMFRKELEVQGASLGIMSVFDSMCSYLGGESRDLNRALATLEETEQQKEAAAKLAYEVNEGLENLRFEHFKQSEELAEAQQQLVSKTLELTQAQQTIARQREALVATGLPEWAVDAIWEGAKES